MVNVVVRCSTVVDGDHSSNQFNNVVLRQGSGLLFKTESSVELVSTDRTKIVFTIVEEEALYKLSGVVNTRRLSRSEASVEL